MKYKDIISEAMAMPMDAFLKFQKNVKRIYATQVGSAKDFKKITAQKLGTVHIIEKEGMSNDADKKIIEKKLIKSYPKLTKITWEIK